VQATGQARPRDQSPPVLGARNSNAAVSVRVATRPSALIVVTIGELRCAIARPRAAGEPIGSALRALDTSLPARHAVAE
jgi:hypothetical protein